MELIEELKGDASTRRYFRFKQDKETFIKMKYESTSNAQKEIDNFKYKQGLFKSCNVNVPNIYEINIDDKSLFISDLGSIHLADLDKAQQTNLYKKIVDDIVLYQKPPISLKENFTKELFLEELIKTYKYCFKEVKDIDKNYYLDLAEKLVDLQVNQDYRFTHRDLHSRNIMVKDDKLFLIDFQDARLGPYTYDLASLFVDPYNEYTAEKSVLDSEFLELLNTYSDLLNYSYDETLKSYKINAMQRLLKMLGTFEYLNKEQNKTQYIKYIPVLLNKIDSLIQENNFKEWNKIIKAYSEWIKN